MVPEAVFECVLIGYAIRQAALLRLLKLNRAKEEANQAQRKIFRGLSGGLGGEWENKISGECLLVGAAGCLCNDMLSIRAPPPRAAGALA